MSAQPTLALTMGDPAGVGPECCAKACLDPHVLQCCKPVVIGWRHIFEQLEHTTGIPVPTHIIEPETSPFTTDILPGKESPACGAAAYSCITHAISGCQSGQYDALVTAPINKAALNAAQISFPGHTEILAHFNDHCDVAMMLYDPAITVVLATCHQSLISVSDSLTTKRIVQVGQLLHNNLSAIRRANNKEAPRLAMLGLNPHAGEGGLFGHEEIQHIIPAVHELRSRGITVSDVLPPDTAFTTSNRKRFDGYICMYHDQALIPFKSLAFEEGVNVTLGLPIIRTSVDHGTAFDIAWTNTVDHRSMCSAIKLAVQLVPAS